MHEGNGFLIFPVFFLLFEELVQPFPRGVQVMASPGGFQKDFPATGPFFSPSLDSSDGGLAAELFAQKLWQGDKGNQFTMSVDIHRRFSAKTVMRRI